ncbi:MAG: methyltransferase small [Hyphomicrobiales bacterium]|nr:methyltransferase small [Hyphomicrobiales bacterium]
MSDSDGADLLLGGRLRLHQAAAGHRAGTDAILLAAAAPRDAQGLLIDAGSGSGAAGLAAALDRPGLRVLLIDREPDAVALATRNLAANGMADRGEARAADLLVASSRRAAGIVDGGAEVVISNPPFLDPGQGRRSPDDARARAHVFDSPDGLDRWVRACTALCAPQGEIFLIHRADRLAELLEALKGRAGGVAVAPIHAKADGDAIRVLLRARKGSRAPLRLRPPLVLHGADGRFTPLAEALHRGEAVVEW